MSTYDAVKDLPLEIESYELEPLEQEVARGFTLRRTAVVLRGGGEEGRGEEVDYDPDAQQRFQARRGELPFAGRHTLDSFSVLQSGQTEYRRWAFESAALDLALRQAGRSLGEAVGREAQPLRFVVSTRVANVEGWRALYPELHFKLDPDRDWSDETVSTLAGAGVVETVDFKGIYRAEFGSPPDPELYARIAVAFPEAWIEDPGVDAGDAPHSSRTASASPGTRRSTSGATSRRCRSVRAASTRSRRGSDRCDGCSTSTTRASARASASTAAASSSSARAVTRSSCSPRSSTRTRRTTSRRPGSMQRTGGGLPTPPLSLSPRPGFRVECLLGQPVDGLVAGLTEPIPLRAFARVTVPTSR